MGEGEKRESRCEQKKFRTLDSTVGESWSGVGFSLTEGVMGRGGGGGGRGCDERSAQGGRESTAKLG